MVNKKLNIILDLDQTLISAEPSKEFSFTKNKNKVKKFNFHDMIGYYIIFERPGLQDFLDYLFKNFNVSVWTAATKEYALFVIEKVILKNSERKLEYVFHSEHCKYSKKNARGPKDLNVLWEIYKLPGYNKKNTIIIDDLKEIFEIQKKNCINIKPFYFIEENSNTDDEFKKVKEKLERTRKKFEKD